MLATNNLNLHASPAKGGAATAERPRTPAWVNRLLGVRPTPALLIDEERQLPRVYPSVEGVSSASAFRSYPR